MGNDPSSMPPKRGGSHGKHSKEKINIVIVGETGAGKSTWINSFANWMKFNSMEDAEKHHRLIFKIPSQMTFCDENYRTSVISTGTDANEVQAKGQSATQECKAYSFKFNGKVIRLIDTPGVGDVRGSDQDVVNFKKITAAIEGLPTLHAVLILMKPNNARLTPMLEYCIKGLITRIGHHLLPNIVFGFTNTRSTFFKPGDTLPLLTKLLRQNKIEIPLNAKTIYCFDSEPYRYLAAIKDEKCPITFSDIDRSHFNQSWKLSWEQAKLMMKHIETLQPRQILTQRWGEEILMSMAQFIVDSLVKEKSRSSYSNETISWKTLLLMLLCCSLEDPAASRKDDLTSIINVYGDLLRALNHPSDPLVERIEKLIDKEKRSAKRSDSFIDTLCSCLEEYSHRPVHPCPTLYSVKSSVTGLYDMQHYGDDLRKALKKFDRSGSRWLQPQ